MKIRPILLGLAAWVFLISPAICSAQMGNLRAGAAKVDITPTKDMFPLNQGQLFGSIHDPLYARALVLDNGSVKVALISADTTGLPGSDELVKAVTAELGIPPEHLILNATHDHNAPTGGNEEANHRAPYFAILKKGIVEAARQANANLQPARIGFGTGKAYVNTNRDQKLGEGYHMGYTPEGPSDKTVAVIEVTNASGDPIAVYANYAVHGVVMYASHTLDGQIQISSDLPGWASNYVEDRLKNNVVALWTSGAAGDQNPIFMSNYNQDAEDVYDEGAAGWAILDVESRRLGEEIVRVTKNIQNTTDRVVLWGAQTSVTCPGQMRAKPPQPGTPTFGRLAPPTIKMKDGNPVNIPLTLLMVNDIAVAGVSGEVFTEIGEHLKQDSLFEHTMMVTLLPNGIGYIPTDKAYLLPSEKAVGNQLKPGCAEPAIVGGFKSLEAQYLPIWKAAN